MELQIPILKYIKKCFMEKAPGNRSNPEKTLRLEKDRYNISGSMSDHVHVLLEIPSKVAASSFMGYLKGKSSLMFFNRYANLKYKYGNW